MFFITACSNTRHLPAGEKLYTGANVNVDGHFHCPGEKSFTGRPCRINKTESPIQNFLVCVSSFGYYNLFRNKKENSFFGRIRDKNGEPPVLLEPVDLEQNISVLQSHLENKGYFRAKVTGDTIIRRQKAHARYQAQAGDQYKIACRSVSR